MSRYSRSEKWSLITGVKSGLMALIFSARSIALPAWLLQVERDLPSVLVWLK